MKKVNAEHFQKSIKIVLASIFSIVIADLIGLDYAATAGIITILSIQNTKRDTFKSARNRGIAFICALVIAVISYHLLGYTLWGFGLYLFLFVLLCLNRGWVEAIAMDSVLISHFLTTKSMNYSNILNEVTLFAIGVGLGILINLHLHRKDEEFERLAEAVDEQFKGILHCMSRTLLPEDCNNHCSTCFNRLKESIKEAKQCAAINYNNVLINNDTSEMDYIQMRENQSVVLMGIRESIQIISFYPKQAEQISSFFSKIEEGFHKDNTVDGLMMELNELLESMEKQELPITRDEFESRAILFYILMQIRNLLQIKQDYYLNKTSRRLNIDNN